MIALLTNKQEKPKFLRSLLFMAMKCRWWVVGRKVECERVFLGREFCDQEISYAVPRIDGPR
jgi:hypothetical protein